MLHHSPAVRPRLPLSHDNVCRAKQDPDARDGKRGAGPNAKGHNYASIKRENLTEWSRMTEGITCIVIIRSNLFMDSIARNA